MSNPLPLKKSSRATTSLNVPIPGWLESAFFAMTDVATAVWPRAVPPLHYLRDCHVVAHRGMYNARDVLENTIPAFDAALGAGAWGIEFDVRWTRDRLPVVCHDPDCRRVFRMPTVIHDTDLAALKDAVPHIPTLAEVLCKYGKRAHLMIELKSGPVPYVPEQIEILKGLLKSLVAEAEFHVLTDDVGLLEALEFLPLRTLLPLARTDLRQKSKLALSRNYGGLLGHYALLSTALVTIHTSRGQDVGTGFIASQKCFFREVSRGVRWIFTDHCAFLARLRYELLRAGGEH